MTGPFPIRAGLDEAGYGPMLGPLTVGTRVETLVDIETWWHRMIHAAYQYGDDGLVRLFGGRHPSQQLAERADHRGHQGEEGESDKSH